jgi:hypothetical protein
VKRLRKTIFNGLTVLSLLAFVVAFVLWTRSYSVADSFTYGRNGYAGDGSLIRWFFSMQSSGGHLTIGSGYSSSLFFRATSVKEGMSWSHGPPPQKSKGTMVWSFLGFEYHRAELPSVVAIHAPSSRCADISVTILH